METKSINNIETAEKRREYSKNYYQKNKEKISVQQHGYGKIYYQKNKDRLVNYSKDYYLKNKDEITRKNREKYQQRKMLAMSPELLNAIKEKLPELEAEYKYLITRDGKGITVDVVKIPDVIDGEIKELKVSAEHNFVITYKQYKKNNDFEITIPKEYLKYKPISSPTEAITYLNTGKYDITATDGEHIYAIQRENKTWPKGKNYETKI